MRASQEHRRNLSDEQRRLLDDWLAEFDRHWTPDSLQHWESRLQPLPEELKLAALIEFVKIDLRRSWKMGNQVPLSAYLTRFPNLGTRQTIPIELIQVECEVRREFNLPASLEFLASEYPGREPEIREMLDGLPTVQGVAADTASAVLETDARYLDDSTERAEERRIPKQFGRYHIIRQLGHGGMGKVYLAEDTSLQRKCAVKIPHFSAKRDGVIIERFYREARAAARVEHPNICTVYEVGEIDGVHYISMAYIDGRPLSEYISRSDPGEQRATVQLIHQLALALAEAHLQQIVHRDLKPANIMIKQNRQPVVMDFGLACSLEASDRSRMTADGTVMGSPAYMSPEQVLGKIREIGVTSDVYSLGVILYEMLTGRVPFEGSMQAILGQIIGREPSPLSELRSDVDPALEQICLKMLSKEPGQRYPSMTQVATALSTWLRTQRGQSSTGSDSDSGGDSSIGDASSWGEDAIDTHIGAAERSFPEKVQFNQSPAGKNLAAEKTPIEGSPVPRPLAQVVDEKARTALLPQREDRGKNHESSRRTSGRNWWVVGVLAVCIVGVVALAFKLPGVADREVVDPLANAARSAEWSEDGEENEMPIASENTSDREDDGTPFVAENASDDEDVEMPIAPDATNGEDEETPLVTDNASDVEDGEPSDTESTSDEDGDEDDEASIVMNNTPEDNTPDAVVPALAPPGFRLDPALRIAPYEEAQAKAVAEAQAAQERWASYLGVDLVVRNEIGMELTLIPPGEFLMGSPAAEALRQDDEHRHDVRLTQPFYVGVYEVTQSDWQTVMGSNPSYYASTGNGSNKVAGMNTGRFPVETVSWYDAIEFCNSLSRREDLPEYYRVSGITREEGRITDASVMIEGGKGYRLLTEAEWEYACRAGAMTPFHFSYFSDGSQSNVNGSLPYRTETEGPHLMRTTTVGSYSPNAFGLCDMHGNVWEWCWDGYDAEAYSDGSGTAIDPVVNSPTDRRVLRGGSSDFNAGYTRAAIRWKDAPDIRSNDYGFRISRTP